MAGPATGLPTVRLWVSIALAIIEIPATEPDSK